MIIISIFCLIAESTMMDEEKVLDDEMLQDLLMLHEGGEGGKEVCKDP